MQEMEGPLRVVAQTSPVNYRVQVFSGKRKPHIVHVERLKLYHERLDDEEPDEFAVSGSSELGHKLAGKSERVIPEFLFDESASDVHARPKRAVKPVDRLVQSMFAECFVCLAGVPVAEDMTCNNQSSESLEEQLANERLDYGDALVYLIKNVTSSRTTDELQ